MSLAQSLKLLDKAQSPALAKTVGRLVRKIAVLQKTLETDVPDEVAGVASEQQRQALSQLQTLSHEPVGAIGYTIAKCVTNSRVDNIFAYRQTKEDHSDTALLGLFFDKGYLFSLLEEYNVLDKVESPASFTQDFPDISKTSFDPFLYDSLNGQRAEKHSFSVILAQALHREYKQSDRDDVFARREKARVETIISELSEKGYPSVQLLSAGISAQKGDVAQAKELYSKVLRNKYSSPHQTASAKDALHLNENTRKGRLLLNALNRSYQSERNN